MNLYSCIKALETIAKSHPSVNETGNGSIYDFANDNPSLKYACFFISQTTHREDNSFSYYGFNLFYFDRLIDDLESNRLQIQSIGKDVLTNTLKLFIESFVGSTYSQLVFVPFTQRFSDLCAGIYCTVQLKIPKAIICSEDFEELVVFTGDCQTCYDEGYQDGLSQTYEDGFESGKTYQKSLLTATQFTENGTYAREDGYSVVTVNVDTLPYYNSGWTDGYSSGNTDGYQEGYEDGLADCGSDYDEGYADGIEHQKSLLTGININSNGVYTSEDGYSAITVNVAQTGHTDQEIIDSYNSGYTSGMTDGFDMGYESGTTDQKNKLTSIYINENGQYNRVDGYSSVTVEIAQTGYTQDDLNHYYNSGYTSGWTDGYNSGSTDGFNTGYESGTTDGYNDGYDSGITYQKSLLSYSSFTENGTYTKNDGWSAVTVNIDTDSYFNNGYNSGYTVGYLSGSTDGFESGWTNGYNSGYSGGYDEGYNSGTTDGFNTGYVSGTTDGYESGITDGYESGITYQKSLLSYSSFTENGTYTIENGWSAVTVNINQQASFDSGYTIGYQKAKDRYTYLTFEMIEGGTLYWVTDNTANTKTIQYSINGGTWTDLTPAPSASVSVSAGDIIRWRGDNTGYGTLNQGSCHFNTGLTDIQFYAYGNVNSLLSSCNFGDIEQLEDDWTFFQLFQYSRGMKSHPIYDLVLPATGLTEGCYHLMFYSCTGITRAPELPATTLKASCYRNMFQSCYSLEKSPDLNAITLVSNCYNNMFVNCSSLNYVKCLAKNGVNTNYSTTNWLYGVSSTGTFIKNPDMYIWPTNYNGIPNGWTVQDVS